MKVYILNKYTKIYLVLGKIVFFNFVNFLKLKH